MLYEIVSWFKKFPGTKRRMNSKGEFSCLENSPSGWVISQLAAQVCRGLSLRRNRIVMMNYIVCMGEGAEGVGGRGFHHHIMEGIGLICVAVLQTSPRLRAMIINFPWSCNTHGHWIFLPYLSQSWVYTGFNESKLKFSSFKAFFISLDMI